MLLKDQRGSTLIELMAAFFVIAMGLMGAMALTTNNLKNETIGANRLIATNLAREGVELARSIRDTNWQTGATWDQGLQGGSATDHCTVLNNSRLAFVSTSCAAVFDNRFRLYKSTDGVYTTNTADTPTPFYRKVIFDPICLVVGSPETTPTTSNCPVGSEKIGVHITSQVGVQAIANSTITLEESLYNWR